MAAQKVTKAAPKTTAKAASPAKTAKSPAVAAAKTKPVATPAAKKTAAAPASRAKVAAAKAPPPKLVVNTVTVKHLAASLAEQHDLPKKQAETLMADIVGMLVEHLKEGDRLRIGGLGILEVKSRPERMGRNPATGAAIQIKASRKIAFRAAKELKDSI
jgi:DNA-binding protein HU-beta